MKSSIIPLLVSLAAGGCAQSLGDLLGSNPQFATLGNYISNQRELQSLLKAQNVTVLAPDTAALEQMFPPGFNGTGAINNAHLINAIIMYHVLKGKYKKDDITKNSKFLPTMLDDRSFENVTDGQVVQAFEANDTNFIYSGMGSSCSIVVPNLKFDGGIIHVVDDVLTLPQNISTSAIAANLTSFAALLQAANITAKIDHTPDITVFAPNNQAFERVGSVFSNISPTNLSQIANYHILEGEVLYSANLTNKTIRTLNGKEAHLNVIDGTAYINSAEVLSTDLLTNNGVVHIIDNVLNPENTTAKPIAGASTQPIAFAGATPATNDIVRGVAGPASAITLAPSSSLAAAEATATGTKTSKARAPVETGMAGAGIAVAAGVGALLVGV
ncbi:hypothetical protein FQN52_000850 [Onygenales sp. PD_12]|nr:hypothetical protein FQN52_000850 [Onygenales sp. PD_12]